MGESAPPELIKCFEPRLIKVVRPSEREKRRNVNPAAAAEAQKPFCWFFPPLESSFPTSTDGEMWNASAVLTTVFCSADLKRFLRGRVGDQLSSLVLAGVIDGSVRLEDAAPTECVWHCGGSRSIVSSWCGCSWEAEGQCATNRGEEIMGSKEHHYLSPPPFNREEKTKWMSVWRSGCGK